MLVWIWIKAERVMLKLFLVLIYFYAFQIKSASTHETKKHPIDTITHVVDKLLSVAGVQKFINGDERTNRGRVLVPVRAARPPIPHIVHYYFYALASLCESSLEQWNCYYCQMLGKHVELVSIDFSTKYHTKSFIALDHKLKDIVLVYRGGINLGNGLTTMQIVLTKIRNDTSSIRVHTGFLESVEDTYEINVHRLKHLTSKYPDYKIVITGLSLGGSQALVMLLLLKRRYAFHGTKFELYTYAQPRAGNRAFVDYINSLEMPIARVVHQNDFFVRVFGSALGFYHHQNEIFIEDSPSGIPTIHYCSQEFYEDRHCGQSAGISLLLTQPLFGFVDHFTYFGLDTLKCIWESPLEIILQAIWNVRPYIPQPLLQQLPKFSINTRAVVDFRHFVTYGIKNLYQDDM